MVKKLLATVSVLAFALSFSACGGNTTNTSGDAGGDNGGRKQVTITAWTGSDYAKDEVSQINKEKFKKEYPWITVNNIVHDGDRVSDYITAVASGNAPDVVAISYPMLSKLVFGELIAPIDEYWDKWEEAPNFKPEVIENCRINGKLYGIPGESYLMGMVYNKRLFEQAGITAPPTTWDELVETAKKLTDPSKQQVGFGLLTGQWVDWWFEYFVWQAGGDLTRRNEDGTVTCTFDDPAVYKAAEFYRRLKQERVIQADLTTEHKDMQNNFAMGKIGMTLSPIGETAPFTSLGMKKEDIGFAVFPKGPAGVNPSQFGGNLFGINAKSSPEVKEAVFNYLSFTYAKEQQITKLEFDEGRGRASLRVSTRNDINILDYQPSLSGEKDFLDVLDSAMDNLMLEYYAKGSVGKYIDAAVQKIVADDSADIKAEFEKAQQLAEKEGAADFNKDIKK